MKFMVFLVVFVLGWEGLWWALGIQPLGPWTLRGILRNDPSAVNLIDVRICREYEWFHIPEAIHYSEFFRQPEQLPANAKERPVVVVCLSGHRAPLAALRLKEAGFSNVSYLSWGMLAWLLSGGETVSGQGRR